MPPDASVSPASVFPHPENFADPATHGPLAAQSRASQCVPCHQGEASRGAPACSSCHADYPHGEGWALKENHGAHVVAEGNSQCATLCHGYDLGGGLSRISCTRCHEMYPHVAGWQNPNQHGESSEGDEKSLCRGCHGDDLRGGISAVSCYRCHTEFPHAENWGTKESHGNFVLSNGTSSCATECHGTNLQGGLSGVSCTSCHNVYPHTTGWGVSHGESAITLGNSACTSCHGSDYRTVLDGKNCFTCHEDYPHPDRATWIPYSGGHGARVNVNYSGSADSCKLCHGDDLGELKNGENCFTCHPSFPHDEASSPAWNTFEGHGQYTVLRSVEECKTCHGARLTGGRNDSCFSCHRSYPHAYVSRSLWGSGAGHGTYTRLHTIEECRRCHGPSLDGGISGVSCYSCHEDYPHGAFWEDASEHGPYFSGRYTSVTDSGCTDCHGNTRLPFSTPQTWTDLMSRANCYGCHWTYPHFGYSVAGRGVSYWEPASTSFSGLGHVFYLMQSPFLVDSTLYRPTGMTDPRAPAAVAFTCGGTIGGLCHFNGLRSVPVPAASSMLCSGYCHRP